MEKILGEYFDMPKNEMQLFENAEFGKIRTLVLNREPWFVGKDVAEKLGYENQNRDIQRHVDEEDRIMLNAETQYQNGTEFDYKILGQRGGWIINESGLYALIFGSKLESAKRFKHWVTSEVLPAIRKTGTYNLTPQNHMELMFQDMKMEWNIGVEMRNEYRRMEKENFCYRGHQPSVGSYIVALHFRHHQQHDSHAKHHHESSYDKHLPPSQPFADVAADYS